MILKATMVLSTSLVLFGCATNERTLMPTPSMYQMPGGQPVFKLPQDADPDPNLDLLYITDRGPETSVDGARRYGEERAKQIVFGTAKVRMVPPLDWETLRAQSQLGERTREVNLELGAVHELGVFPQEPYRLTRTRDGIVLQDRAELEQHAATKAKLAGEVQRRLAAAPNKEILLYVHGFNETFATAAFTVAELCHFLGREQVCAFFTWPASATGDFLTSLHHHHRVRRLRGRASQEDHPPAGGRTRSRGSPASRPQSWHGGDAQGRSGTRVGGRCRG